jgi:hypothetical protein
VLGPGGLTLVCSSALFVSSLDVTVVNVALPAFAHAAVGAGPAQLQWIVDAYTLTLAVLLLLGGALGDRLGQSRPVPRRADPVRLRLARLRARPRSRCPDRGPRAASLRRCPAAAERAVHHHHRSIGDPRQRARAIGVWAGVFGLAAAVGPLVGGLLIDAAGWRWIFLINLPVVAAALLFSLRLPETRGTAPRPLDFPGISLAALAVFGLTYLLIEGSHTGYTAALCPSARASWRACARARFILAERRRAHPLFPLSLLQHRRLHRRDQHRRSRLRDPRRVPVHLERLLAARSGTDSALSTGFALLPATFGIAVISPITGRLIHRLGSPRSAHRSRRRADHCRSYLLIAAASGHAYLPYAAGYLVARHRVRAREPADHQHRHQRAARPPGRRRLRPGHHLPADR